MGEETTLAAPDNAETFAFFDPQRKQNINLPSKAGEVDLKPLLESVIGHARKERRETLQKEIEELRGQLSKQEQLQARVDELESATLPAKERESKEFEKQFGKLKADAEKARAESAQYQTILKTEKLSNALMREAAKYPDIIDIEQTTTLFQAQCSPTLSIDGDSVRLSAKLNGEDTELSEAFTKWLASDRNANLLKNKLHPGSGSAGGSRAATAQTMTRAQFSALSPAQQHAAATAGVKLS